jgi:hypothetical protein
MNNYFRFISIGICLLILSCSSIGLDVRDEINSDYQIYSVFVNYFIEKLSEKKVDTIVIGKETGIHDDLMEIEQNENLRYILNCFAALQEITFKDFLRNNASSTTLTNNFCSKYNIILVGPEEIDELIIDANWEKFYKKYSNAYGMIGFSKVGYSKDKEQAIIYYAHRCGGKYGSGNLAFFELERGVWQLKFIFPLWFS